MPPGDVSTRRTPPVLLAAAGLLLAARVVVAVGGPGTAPERPDLVKWVPLAQAEAGARKTGRPVLYDFTAAWCPPCRKMAGEVFGDRAAAGAINESFVPVRVMDRSREDGRNPPEVEALHRRFGIKAFPTLVVVRPGRDPVVMEGYAGKAETLKALRDAAGPVKKGK